MSLTYNDLPTRDTFCKLTMTSFATPQKNLDVYRLENDLDFYYKAFDNERNKCLMEFGEPDNEQPGRYIIKGESNVNAYNAKIKTLCNTIIGIDPKINPINLTFEDFTNCVYHKDQNLWLSATEIKSILEFVRKIDEVTEK